MTARNRLNSPPEHASAECTHGRWDCWPWHRGGPAQELGWWYSGDSGQNRHLVGSLAMWEMLARNAKDHFPGEKTGYSEARW